MDYRDFKIFMQAYNTRTGDPSYNPRADFDSDGDIDIYDFSTFSIIYTKHNTDSTVWMSPVSVTVERGGTFSVRVIMNSGGVKLASAMLDVTGDQNVFTVEKVTDGLDVLLESPDNTDTLPLLHHAHSFYPYPDSQMTFLTLEFKVSDSATCGNYNLEIQNPLLLDTQARPLEGLTTGGAVVEVVGCS